LGDEFVAGVVTPMQREFSEELNQYNLSSPLPNTYDLKLPEVKMQLADLPVPKELKENMTVEKYSIWYWLHIIPYKEIQVQTHFELNPVDLRETVNKQILSLCKGMQKNVEGNMKKIIESLFVPFFEASKKAISDISEDLFQVQAKLMQSEQEIRQFKNEAEEFVSALKSMMGMADELKKSPELLVFEFHVIP